MNRQFTVIKNGDVIGGNLEQNLAALAHTELTHRHIFATAEVTFL